MAYKTIYLCLQRHNQSMLIIMRNKLLSNTTVKLKIQVTELKQILTCDCGREMMHDNCLPLTRTLSHTIICHNKLTAAHTPFPDWF